MRSIHPRFSHRPPGSALCRIAQHVAIPSLLLLFVGVWPERASASSSRRANRQTRSAAPAARIDDTVVISHREVEQMVRSVVNDQPISEGLRAQMRRQALQQLIGQRLILAALEKEKSAASETDVDLYIDQLQSRLQKQHVSWEEFLQQLGVSREEYRTSVRWKLSWDNHLRTFLTAENLQRYFEQHRRDYDGTEVVVAQILLKVPPESTPDQIEAAQQRLGEIRQKIERGEINFAEAAKQFSEAASAAEGGMLGRLERQGAMPEAFTAAAFQLQPGEISPAITTNIGVHLIHCEAVIPGDKQLSDVEPEVRRGATRFLFDWRVERERKHHRIEILLENG